MPNVFSSILKGSSEHKKVGGGGDFEFDHWQPVASLGKNEAMGLASATAHLEPLASKHILPIVPLENYFGDLFSRVWKKATPTAGVPRGNFLAQTRAPSPSSKPAQPYQPQVSPTAPPTGDAHLKSIANDWKMMEDLERICAYTWRGDGRDPAALKAAGGFQPPSTRNDDGYIKGAVYKQFCSYLERRAGRDIASTVSADDFLTIVRQTLTSPEAKSLFVDYCIWRSLVKSEELHLGRMLANEALKGYISTTKSVSVAKAFACMRDSSAGWVYLVLIKGGFAVPDKGKHAWTAIFGEQEIAMPGAVSWAHVYGYRQAGKGKFNPASPIALRKGLKEDEPTVFKEAYDLLSGKSQG